MMSPLSLHRCHGLLVALMVLLMAAPLLALQAVAETGPAIFDPARSQITAEGRDRGKPRPLDVTIGLSHQVPYRVFFLADPPRLVVDFRELDFATNSPEALTGADLVPALRWGRFREGWSRMVAELPGPYALTTAIQDRADSGATIQLRLDPVRERDFTVRNDTMGALWDLPENAVPLAAPRGVPGLDRPVRVAIDPGHGGIDPGAQVGPISEAAVILNFSLELAKTLRGAGIEVVMTRDSDIFVPLERRMTIARAGGADLLISLHADALPEGQATGLTIYTWDPAANDRAARELAARHDRDDLLAGVDLEGTEDEIVQTLIDLARTDTQPRAANLAGMLASEFSRGGFDMHRRPVRGAGFSVLKAPDIPSVLIELGFLTDDRDRANLLDPAWQGRMAGAITRAILAWTSDEQARAGHLRK